MTKKVEIYSTPSCIHCQHAKEFFKEHGIEYVEYNVASDLERRKEMVDKTSQMGVPVIVIDDTDVVIGFNKGHLEKVLLGE